MTYLIKRINLQALLIALASTAAMIGIGITGASAIDRDIAAQDAVHLEHKLYLDENSNDDYADDMTEAEYQASQPAKVAAHANNIIAKAYGREL